MTPITATVHNGKIEVLTPGWPDGCEVIIQPLSGSVSGEDAWPTDQAGRDAWLEWYTSLEPLVFTPAEEADIAAWREQVKAYSIDNARQIEELFE